MLFFDRMTRGIAIVLLNPVALPFDVRFHLDGGRYLRLAEFDIADPPRLVLVDHIEGRIEIEETHQV